MRELATSSSCSPPHPQDDLSSEESSLTSSVIAAMEAADDDLESNAESRETIDEHEQLTITTDEEEESAYEKLQSENIRDKQRQLESLGISNVVNNCKPKPKPKKPKILSTQPIRKSTRIAERGQNTGTSSGVDGEAGSVGL